MKNERYPRLNTKDVLPIVKDKLVIDALKMSNYIYYQHKSDYPEQISVIKKGLVAQMILNDLNVPEDFMFKTPLAIKGDNDKMIELYKLGLYAETLLKVDVFTALIKADNKKV